MNKKEIGRAGEELASLYLSGLGYSLLQRNFRASTGEIDIIARRNNTLYFFEVKTRSSTLFGLPREALNRDKIRHMRNTAEVYLKQKGLSNVNCQLKLIEVTINEVGGIF